MVYAVASTLQPINEACPPIPGTNPVWVGYWNAAGGWVPGDPPSGWVPCGAKADVELAGRTCLFNTVTGEYAGALFVETSYDTSQTPPVFTGYMLAALLPDGTVQRPYIPNPDVQHEPCPTSADEPVPMHECTPGGCVPFLRWFNSATKLPISDRDLNGAAYTILNPARVSLGHCSPPERAVGIVHECVAGECRSYWQVLETSPCVTVPPAYYNPDWTPVTPVDEAAVKPGSCDCSGQVDVWHDDTPCVDILRIETCCGPKWTLLDGTAYTPIDPKHGGCKQLQVTVEQAHWCQTGTCTTGELVKVFNLASLTPDVPETVTMLTMSGVAVNPFPVNVEGGACLAPTEVIEIVGYAGLAGCRTIEVRKTINSCTGAAALVGYELSGVTITPFDPALIVKECPCVPGPVPHLITDFADLRA